MQRWSSLRRPAAPIPVALMAVSSLDDALRSVFSLRCRLDWSFSHCLGAGRNRLDDVVVAGATAEIALELVANGGVVELVSFTVHHIHGGHDHPGGAIAALQAVVLAEGLLHGMQRSARLGQALDGGDVGALELPNEYSAGFDRLAVNVDNAGTALRGVAAHMGAGEPQVLTQVLHQKGARIDVTGDGFAVHRQCDGGHGFLLEIRPKALFSAPTGRAGGRSGQNRVDFAPKCDLEQVNSEPVAPARSR